MDKRFLGILTAISVIFIGVFVITQHSSNNSSGSGSSSGAHPSTNIEGQGSSGVTLIEYGDYECPICEAYYQPLKQAVAQYSNQIYFQFRNLPLTSIHPNAFAAARAAQAAALQGKFWPMHDKLYDNQNSWINSQTPIDIFTTYAQQIGLDVNQFKTDYNSSAVNNTINADLGVFAKTGQDQATPSFFLDGKFLPNTGLTDPSTGIPTAAKIGAAIQAEINSKTKSQG